MGQTLFLALCTDYAFNPLTAELHTTIPILHEPHLVEITQRGARGGSEAPALHCLTRGQGLRPHAGRLLRARHCDSTFFASSHFNPTAAPQGGQCHLLCLTEARSSPERLSPEEAGRLPPDRPEAGAHTPPRGSGGSQRTLVLPSQSSGVKTSPVWGHRQHLGPRPRARLQRRKLARMGA